MFTYDIFLWYLTFLLKISYLGPRVSAERWWVSESDLLFLCTRIYKNLVYIFARPMVMLSFQIQYLSPPSLEFHRALEVVVVVGRADPRCESAILRFISLVEGVPSNMQQMVATLRFCAVNIRIFCRLWIWKEAVEPQV